MVRSRRQAAWRDWCSCRFQRSGIIARRPTGRGERVRRCEEIARHLGIPVERRIGRTTDDRSRERNYAALVFRRHRGLLLLAAERCARHLPQELHGRGPRHLSLPTRSKNISPISRRIGNTLSFRRTRPILVLGYMSVRSRQTGKWTRWAFQRAINIGDGSLQMVAGWRITRMSPGAAKCGLRSFLSMAVGGR